MINPFVNGLRLAYYITTCILCVCMCVCVHACMCICACGQYDRCWTATVIDYNAYWVTLPTGGWHKLLEGQNCNVQVALNCQQ